MGYRWFEGQLKKLRDEGHEVRVAVESTGNTRYFKRRVEAIGVAVVVINTMKFNVLAEHGLAGQAVEPLLETIERLETEVKKLEGILEQKVREDRAVELLKTIPGAGIITAATIRAYVDDIGRFFSYKQFSAYAGLVPWVQNSNRTERYGSITRRGPCELRTALVQVVLGMVRNKRTTGGYRIMGRYAAMKKEKGSGKAIIATARKLSKIVWYMLRNEAPFDLQRMKDPGVRKIAEEMRAAGLPAA